MVHGGQFAEQVSHFSTTTMQGNLRQADEALLASLGYKQEFRREFAPREVFGIAFSIIGLLPSIASVLVYALPNGGPVAMVWGWFVASLGVLSIGISMAELASAAPTSGGVKSFSVIHGIGFLKVLYSRSSTSGHIPCPLLVADVYWRGWLVVSRRQPVQIPF